MNEPVRNPPKLEPCPFCGGEAQIEDWDVGHESGTTILCRKCCACISESVVDGDGWHDRAVEEWNRRAERTGRWIPMAHPLYGKCSRCGEIRGKEDAYCKDCGAHMIGG